MNKFKMVIAVVVMSTLVSGCVSREKYEKLEAENEELKLEIDELLNGDTRLMESIEADFKEGNQEEALETIATLKEKHPESEVIGRATEIENAINQELETKRQERQIALDNALASMTKREDEFEGVTWYSPSMANSFDEWGHKKIQFYLYVGIREESKDPWYRLALKYYASDWLFIESAVIKVGEEKHTIFADIESEVYNGGDIIEWFDISPSSEDLDIIQKIIDTGSATIRLEGDTYSKDFEITGEQIEAFKNSLLTYEVLSSE